MMQTDLQHSQKLPRRMHNVLNRYSKENDAKNARKQDTEASCFFRGDTPGGIGPTRK